MPTPARRPAPLLVEWLEGRDLPSAAFDITGLTALRANAAFADVDGALPGQARNIGIAVLDTGLYGNHPDLRGNFVAYYDAVANRTATGPVVTDLAQMGPGRDPNGHGSHTAGTAGSTNPAIGVATGADLIGVRALPSGTERPQHDTVVNALNWVIANQQRFNIRVVNMSLGVPTTNVNDLNQVRPNEQATAIRRLEQLGVTVVVSSGNNYAEFVRAGASTPAAYATVSVANTWEDNGAGDQFPYVRGGRSQEAGGRYFAGDRTAAPDRFAATSQRSTLPNQVAAPGNTIYSTWNGAADPRTGRPKLYETIGGTSMSAPYVSGLVALMQDAAFTTSARYLTPAQVLSILRSTADQIVDRATTANYRLDVNTRQESDLPETGATFARVNALRAVQAARQAVGGNPGGGTGGADANSTTGQAVALPTLNGTRVYSAQGRVGTDGSTPIGANDVDLFRVTVPYRGRLLAVTSRPAGGTGFDSYLRVFNAAGTQVATNDDFNGTLYSGLGVNLTAGTYYIGVSSFSNTAYGIASATGRANGRSQGDYLLQVQLTNPNTASSGSTSPNPYFDPNGTLDGAVDYPAGDGITPYYDEAFTRFDDPDNPDASGRTGYLVAGLIGSDPPPQDDATGTRPDVGPGDVDMFRYVVPDDGRLFIRATSNDAAALAYPLGRPSGAGTGAFDTYLRVFDENGNQVAVDDDGGPGLDSQILLTGLTRGRVLYLAVSGFGNGSYDPADPNSRAATGTGGYYELWSTFDNGDLNGTAFTAVRLPAVGTPAGGTVGTDFNGPTVGADGRLDVDFLSLDVPAGPDQVLRVTATGQNGFQPTATVWGFRYDAAGNVTGFDQIATSTRDRAVVLAPVTGGRTYYVSFTGQGNGGFNWYAAASGTGGQTGQYTVQTELLPPSAGDAIRDRGVVGGGAPPRVITLGTAAYGTIGEDAAANGDTFVVAAAAAGGFAYGVGDLDTYAFVAPFTGRVQFRATGATDLGSSTDPVMRVFDAAGNELGYNDDESDSSRDAVIPLDVVAGQTYYVGITGFSPDAPDYSILSGTGPATLAFTSVGGYTVSITGTPPVTPPPTGGGSPPPVTTPPPGGGSPPPVITPPVLVGTPFAVGGAPDGSARLFPANPAAGLFAAAPSAAPAPFGNTGTNVRTAVADVNHDGFPDTVFATGPGTTFLVAVVSGADNTTLLVAPFNPFPAPAGVPEFAAGGFVSAGDFDGDGRAEFVVSPDRSGGPRVSIFSVNPDGTLALRANFFTVDPGFRGGARTAVGDVNHDGTPDLAVAAGFGGGPRVVLFNGTRALVTTGFDDGDKLVPDFFAFPDTVRNGVYLAAGDVDGDGFADLIFGAAAGGSPAVKVVSGQALLAPGGNVAAVDGPLSGFTFDDPASTGGVRVAAVNVDGDGRADVAVGTGEGRAARVRVYRGISFAGTTGEPAAFQDLDPFAGAVLTDGVFVG